MSDSSTHSTTPPFNPEKYRIYLEDTDLTQEEQDEYLKLLWSIMLSFVDLGFGVDSVQLAMDDVHERADPNGSIE